jgi:hypothetical protein
MMKKFKHYFFYLQEIFEDVERGVFNSRLLLIYRLAMDKAGRYQLFGNEELDFGDTNNGQIHYQNAVDLYQKLAKYF